MNIAANKVKGAYAALVTDALSAEKARTSNNANIICMGANTLAYPLARKLLEIWDRQEFDTSSPSAPKVDAFVNYDKSRNKRV
jgi:ribose 5-phosphate isomerase B